MPQPSYHAIEWHSPPDLSTREVRSFPSRQERDAFVRGTPRGGTEFRLAVSGAEAASIRRSLRRSAVRTNDWQSPSAPAAGAPVELNC